MDHPSLDITGTDGKELLGKKIVLCVTGSVAAYRAVELARLLMRHGGTVRCVLTPSAAELITPQYMTWATGHPAIVSLGGDMEHISLADRHNTDLILVYPATANTISKMACGIDDTAVSTILTTALGSGMPILVCPAMHDSLYVNPAVRRNIEFLERSVRFAPPTITEGKAKAAEPEEVLDTVIQTISRTAPLRGRRVLVVAGPTLERIDPVRAVTNMSSGLTGVLLASELVLDGCDVTMVYGPGRERPPSGVRLISVTSTAEMMEATLREASNDQDIIVMAAAAADYTPSEYNRSKIDSELSGLDIKMSKTPKIIDRIRVVAGDVLLVGFKAEVNISDEDLIESARQKMKEADADMVIANDVGDGYQSDPENNRVIIVDREGHSSSGRKQKEDVVRFIKQKIEEKWTARPR
ncbi:MAG: bifunctional phosphopantothenoylcysteine decarboxylase/phosphopantothenate--cysteine ligase CoaBC [Thaumarchaeota archaeon]|nr:bifunctional phosphopantothenoylcysteine decarboxylase/phosphopantothenate--cysteine ligase CoaBC [Nitrososphaerota archaeon]